MRKGMNIEVMTDLALEIGLNEAIVLQYVHKLIGNKGVLMDGKRWVSLTYQEWQEIFPFWSISTLKRIFSALKKEGYIEIHQYGKQQYDRTNWYAICDLAKECYFSEDEGGIKEDSTDEHDLPPEIEDKARTVLNWLKERNFYPLKKEQKEELIEACQSFSLAQILEAIERTVSRSVYAWKYTYKVLISSKQKTAYPRKIIRTELLPDWFTTPYVEVEKTPEQLAQTKRIMAIKAKYINSAHST